MSSERKFTILGSPVSKANSRRLVNFGSRPAFIKSEKGLEYEKSCIDQLKKQNRSRKPLRGSVGVEITIWYANSRSDLDPSIILDCMQEKKDKKTKEILWSGIYENDRQIIEMVLLKKLDKDNPRSEVFVYEL